MDMKLIHNDTKQGGEQPTVERTWLIEIRGKLTQEQVAMLSGMSRSAYSNIENGNRGLSVKLAKQIASALKFDWKLFFK